MTEPLPILYNQIESLKQELASRGHLGLIVLDASHFAAIEEQYGSQTYELVRQRIFKLLADQSGKDFRKTDSVMLDRPRGLQFILILDRSRKQLPLIQAHLESLCARLAETLLPLFVRTALPFLKVAPRIFIGAGLSIHNPLVDPYRIIDRTLRQATDHASLQQRLEDLQVLHRLQDVIVRERVVTAFQPIMRIRNHKVHAYEALSRGAPGTGMLSADQLFSAAIKNHLLVELDRLCRKRALLDGGRLPEDARIFINTLPATIRDPEFHGKHLIDLLEKAKVSPKRIVIEITEKLVIDNLNLFQDAMSYFNNLGVALAVDDVGSGYSGLETIARLTPAYLKADAALIRDIHNSVVNREMLKAIVSLGRGIGAAVIAEGIETIGELNAVDAIGVEYGQGYFLGRPEQLPK